MIDRSELFSLYKDAFPYDSDDYANYFISSVEDDDVLTAKRDGKIVSAGYLVHKNAEIFGEKIETDYLSAVGTLSELRGRGIVAEVMKSALEKVNRRQCAFVSLNPFNFEYYKRYGFVDASYCGKNLISGGRDYKIVRATKFDVSTLIGLYKKYSQDFTFKETVDEKYFCDLIEELAVDDENVWIVCDGGKSFAYVAIDNGEIAKFATSDFEKFKTINAFKGMAFCDFHADELAYTQMRIASVETFLSLPIYSEKKLRYGFSISDDIVTKNQGTYLVEINGNDRKVTKTSGDFDESSIDVSDLAEAFFSGSYPFNKPKVLFMDKY